MEVGLVCIVKQENAYLREFVTYYKNLGIDKFYIYDNNDIDGENPKDVIGDFDCVRVIDCRGFKKCQQAVYSVCMSYFHEEFDWLCVFDADEFLFLNEDKNIKDYLSRDCFNGVDSIQISWRNVDDNGLLGNENNNDRSLVDRFVEAEPFQKDIRETKAIIRSCSDIKFVVPHIPVHEGFVYSNNRGDIVPYQPESKYENNWEFAELRHYRKTIIEFISYKLNRGFADGNPLKVDFDYFFRYSKRTPEKEKIAEEYLKNGLGRLKTYITYFDDAQIGEYGLKADDNTILFKGNDTSYSGQSINNLNLFYCELCTLYYVWKNDLKSDYVCFKQYRRPFKHEDVGRMPGVGEVIAYEPISTYNPVLVQYALCHGRKRAVDLYYILCTIFGGDSMEVKYFNEKKYMYTNNSMVLNWKDFCNMCSFVFGVIDKIDGFYGLHYNYKKYEKNAEEYTEDDREDYQKHWMAYIGERLVSCYIDLHLKPLTISRLPINGFYQPYKHKGEA